MFNIFIILQTHQLLYLTQRELVYLQNILLRTFVDIAKIDYHENTILTNNVTT